MTIERPYDAAPDENHTRFDGRCYEGYRVSLRLVRHGHGREPVTLTSPHDTYCFLREIGNLDREVFWRVDLDTRHQVIGCEEVSKGHLSSSLVHPREVYKGAILNSAAAIVVAHNHPSGDPTPSPEDRALTSRLQDAGKLLGIPLTDHVIIGDRCYSSAADGWNTTTTA